MNTDTLTEHIEIARSVMQENYGQGEAHRSYQEAGGGMEALRALAGFILALHPELATDDADARIESLVEVINGEVSDEDFRARLNTREIPLDEALGEARKLGAEHGHAAGTWAFDGNTPHETYVRTLKGIREGDPAVLDSFPAEPHGVGGEYPAEKLYDELDLIYDPAEADEILLITEAYEQAARDAFWAEVERAAIYQVEG